MTDRFLRSIPYDYVYAEDYSEVPELAYDRPDNVIRVEEGRMGWGDVSTNFASEAFQSCTGYVFRNVSDEVFGFLHAYSFQDLSDEDAKKLNLLADVYMRPHKYNLVKESPAGYLRNAAPIIVINENAESNLNSKVEAIPIRGSLSKASPNLVNALSIVGVNVLEPIEFNTVNELGENQPFQVVYRPKSNQILVARNSHKDIQFYRGF